MPVTFKVDKAAAEVTVSDDPMDTLPLLTKVLV